MLGVGRCAYLVRIDAERMTRHSVRERRASNKHLFALASLVAEVTISASSHVTACSGSYRRVELANLWTFRKLLQHFDLCSSFLANACFDLDCLAPTENEWAWTQPIFFSAWHYVYYCAHPPRRHSLCIRHHPRHCCIRHYFLFS